MSSDGRNTQVWTLALDLQYFFWAAAAVTETMVGWLWAVGVARPAPGKGIAYVCYAGHSMGGLGTLFSVYDRLLLAIFITRYILELLVFGLSLVHMFAESPSSESAPLLATTLPRTDGYGAIPNLADGSAGDKPSQSSYADFFSKLKKVMPYIWPANDRWLQFLVVLCFALMVLGLVINVFTPLQIGAVVDQFKESKGRWLAKDV